MVRVAHPLCKQNKLNTIMRRIALLNGIVAHEETIDIYQELPYNYTDYDTLVDDPDELFKIDDIYDNNKYIEHYFPQTLHSIKKFNAPVL